MPPRSSGCYVQCAVCQLRLNLRVGLEYLTAAALGNRHPECRVAFHFNQQFLALPLPLMDNTVG
jgi:hypothetical protein